MGITKRRLSCSQFLQCSSSTTDGLLSGGAHRTADVQVQRRGTVRGQRDPEGLAQRGHLDESRDARTARHIGVDTPLDSQPYIAMWTANGQWQPGWLASQADLLADDWIVVTGDPPPEFPPPPPKAA